MIHLALWIASFLFLCWVAAAAFEILRNLSRPWRVRRRETRLQREWEQQLGAAVRPPPPSYTPRAVRAEVLGVALFIAIIVCAVAFLPQ